MKIFFRPNYKNALPPIPALKGLPDWYKKLASFLDGDKKQKFVPPNNTNATIKRCNPFGDSLGMGYLIVLDQDVQVTKTEAGHDFAWAMGGDFVISTHSTSQIDEALAGERYEKQPYKFQNRWSVETPPGYSALFTHPLNRTDLPFYTLSGVVDTDDYKHIVQFPFLLEKDFEGVIEAGTPIAQVIPIKREPWRGEVMDFDSEFLAKQNDDFKRRLMRGYKNFYWKKKEYK